MYNFFSLLLSSYKRVASGLLGIVQKILKRSKSAGVHFFDDESSTVFRMALRVQ